VTDGSLRYTWDTVGQAISIKVCDEAMSFNSAICHHGTILMNKFPKEDVNYTSTMIYTVIGEGFYKYRTDFPPSNDNFEFGKTWMDLTEKLVAEGK
jgi:hypothetical protein